MIMFRARTACFAVCAALLVPTAALAAKVTSCAKVGLCYCLNDEHKVAIDDKIERLRQAIAAERKAGKLGMVDIKPKQPLKNPVTLAAIKAEPKLANLGLVKQSRLSVMPVDEKSWKLICAMGGIKA